MTEQPPKVSVQLVGYHSQAYLPRCLDAIARAATGIPSELLFIDNGEGQSEEIVRAIAPAARIEPGKGNIGFAAANNLLARRARGDWLLLLNPDTEIEPDAIRQLLAAAAAHPQFHLLAGQTVIDRASGVALAPLEPPGLRMALKSMAGSLSAPAESQPKEQIVPVAAASGGFLMVKRAAWNRLGGMDERYFLYGEDIDLCQRARNIGFGIAIVPGARAVHEIGGGSFYSPRRQLLQMRGNATYVRKHFSPIAASLILFALWISLCLRSLVACVLKGSNPRYRAMFRGIAPLAARPWQWWKGYPMAKNSPP